MGVVMGVTKSQTAFEWDSKTVARKSVEGVLLAYSRHNTSSKFAPELCIITALVLKLMEGEEELSLKVCHMTIK